MAEKRTENKLFSDVIYYCDTLLEDNDNSSHDDSYLDQVYTNTQHSDSSINMKSLVKRPSTSTTRKKRNPNKAEKDYWKEVIAKRKRVAGESFNNRNGISRPSREMSPPCESSFCLKSKKRSCQNVDEMNRKIIFDKFWALPSWDLKQTYIQLLVKRSNIKQKLNTEDSRRTSSYEYYLQLQDGETIQVCKEMFCGTLGIAGRTILDWINPPKRIKGKDNKSSNTGRVLRLPLQVQKHLEIWMSELPTVSSPYCRKLETFVNTKFLYPGTMIVNLYQTYSLAAKELELNPVSSCKFNQIFHKYNYSVFTPKKDQCDLCLTYKQENMDEEEYQCHIHAKELAQSEKEQDKIETDKTTSVWTMDLQCPLLFPKINDSTMYYKHKLQIQNFTLFDLKKKAGYCYIWSEVDGDLSDDVFAFIQYQHFERILTCDRSIKNVIIWSVGCEYQNRNSTIANMYIELARKMNVIIIQKYLVEGHAQMECDSMYNSIERKLIDDIFTLQEYVIMIQCARIKPTPYHIKQVIYSEMKKLSGRYLSNIRPGNKVLDPDVHDLRGLLYQPSGVVKFKLTFEMNARWEELPQKIVIPRESFVWDPLFLAPLPLKMRKFQDLQSMKHIIPQSVHDYYNKLPYEK